MNEIHPSTDHSGCKTCKISDDTATKSYYCVAALQPRGENTADYRLKWSKAFSLLPPRQQNIDMLYFAFAQTRFECLQMRVSDSIIRDDCDTGLRQAPCDFMSSSSEQAGPN